MKAMPKPLTMDCRMMPPMEMMTFFTATGRPSRRRLPDRGPSKAKSSLPKRRRGVRAMRTAQMVPDRHWAKTVASAAPAIPQSSTKTASASRAILVRAATIMATSGVRLSPMARSMEEQKLKNMTAGKPPNRMRIYRVAMARSSTGTRSRFKNRGTHSWERSTHRMAMTAERRAD